MSFNNSIFEPTSRWNDADVFGDINSPEIEALLDQEFHALVGFSSKQQRGTWRLWTTSLRQMIDIKLSRHEVKRRKDGDAMVFAEANATDKIFVYPNGRMALPLCGRSRHDIEAVTFAGYDIDDGDALEFAVERLRSLGYFAILYTTHSHGKRHGECSDTKVAKYRILFPLAEPFRLAPDNPSEHEARCEEWRHRLVNFADWELDLVIDETGCDVNRLFYTPRHKPGDGAWYSAVFAGRALRVEDMPFVRKTSRPAQPRGTRSETDRFRTFTSQRPILSDGFDLIDWRRDWGAWFLVREFFDALQWDVGRDERISKEARVLCPNDHNHSTADDKFGCWVKDGTGTTPFVIYCHHNACREMGTLDQLVELEQCVGLPDGYDTLSEFLCVSSFYSSYINEDDGAWPDPERYRRWDPEADDAETSADAEGEVVQ